MGEVPVIKHPQRYPVHDGDKGQAWGGECNTTACSRGRATYFNNQTYGYYCRICADGINVFSSGIPVCEKTDAPLTIEQMDAIHQADLKARYGSRT